MSNIWFTSDTHYGHSNITGAKVSNWKNGFRNFNSVWEMNQALVEGINKYVGEDDILYHLGDWSFGGVHNIIHFRNSLICKNIHLIKGNHDQHIVDKQIKFGETFFNPIDLFSSVNQVLEVSHGKHKFFLSHYPHLSWHHAYKGVIMLHGHEHGSFNNLNQNTLRMDVGVDSAKLLVGEMRPFRIEEIIDLNSRKKIIPIKHHEE
jgi:calcineurin-like phosphoesterase family protein